MRLFLVLSPYFHTAVSYLQSQFQLSQTLVFLVRVSDLARVLLKHFLSHLDLMQRRCVCYHAYPEKEVRFQTTSLLLDQLLHPPPGHSSRLQARFFFIFSQVGKSTQLAVQWRAMQMDLCGGHKWQFGYSIIKFLEITFWLHCNYISQVM